MRGGTQLPVASSAGCITDVPGIEVGHAQNKKALTGCTVVLCRGGAVAGVDVRGSAPGTRETDLLNPINLVSRVHAILLAGGSAFGLDAASGVVRYLEQRRIGYSIRGTTIPIVPAAILFDLGVGRGDIRPDDRMGFAACRAASSAPCLEGNVGVGTGASVGKLFGTALAMKAGVGSTSLRAGALIVGALVAVNSLGDVVDPANGQIIAGLRSGRVGPKRVGGSGEFASTVDMVRTPLGRRVLRVAAGANTVIGVVATNAGLDKSQATKVAQMSHDGLARAIRPAHTMLDGDTIFALSTGSLRADVTTVGTLAAEAVAAAILRAVRTAAPAGGLPGLNRRQTPLAGAAHANGPP